MVTLRAEVFSPAGDFVSYREVTRESIVEAEDELFDWFNSEFGYGYCCSVDRIGFDGSVLEQLLDWAK